MNELLRDILFLPEQASEFAKPIDQLHYFVIIVTMVMSFAVGLGAIYFFIRYRQRSPNQHTEHIDPPWWVEGLFVGVPLAFFLLWFFIGFRQYVWMTTPPANTMDVYVMGKQWMWKFNYADGPNAISTLRVPLGRPVRLLITSRDVLHSFYVPAFRVKQDAVPGRYAQLWFNAVKTGRYPIFCAEYCGLTHSGMTGEVIVMEGAEFDSWMAEQKRGLTPRQDSTELALEDVPAATSMVEQGRLATIKYGCVKCHTVDGSPHIGPTWLDMYHRQERLEGGKTILVDEAYITESMMDPKAKLVAGFQPVMPSFSGQISPPETAAIIEYIKSLRSDRLAQEAPRNPL